MSYIISLIKRLISVSEKKKKFLILFGIHSSSSSVGFVTYICLLFGGLIFWSMSHFIAPTHTHTHEKKKTFSLFSVIPVDGIFPFCNIAYQWHHNLKEHCRWPELRVDNLFLSGSVDLFSSNSFVCLFFGVLLLFLWTKTFIPYNMELWTKFRIWMILQVWAWQEKNFSWQFLKLFWKQKKKVFKTVLKSALNQN